MDDVDAGARGDHDRAHPFDGQLERIVGDWATTGEVIGDPPVRVVGSDVYELLAGGYFLVHHVDVTVGDQPVRAIEIIGEPAPDGDAVLARSFDDHGNVEVMRLTVRDGTFSFVGGPDVGSAARPANATTAQVRSTLEVAPDARSMTARWERSPDGTRWEPWMDIRFSRNDTQR
jgi:hypothetical protein